jgi:ABC-type branched-subunit amino acid transport system permease subunit
MVGIMLVVVSPLRGLLQIQGDLSDYVIHLGVLGLSLVILTGLTGMSRVLKSFLITAGASALGWPISLYLHNLLIRSFPTEPVTYLLVFFVLPITFLAGVLGAAVIGIKQFVSSR